MNSFVKLLNNFAIRLAKWTDNPPAQVIEISCEDDEPKEAINEPIQEVEVHLAEETEIEKQEIAAKKSRRKKPKEGDIIIPDYRDIRDIMELMEVPLVSISKTRISPIVYENHDASTMVKITPHTGHYVASIYDWDIIIVIASKMQEVINDLSDMSVRTIFEGHFVTIFEGF